MAPYSVLVTGANRGIGLALVREFLKDENIQIIIAGARNPEAAEDLKSIKDDRLRIIKLDISSDESIDGAVEEVIMINLLEFDENDPIYLTITSMIIHSYLSVKNYIGTFQ